MKDIQFVVWEKYDLEKRGLSNFKYFRDFMDYLDSDANNRSDGFQLNARIQ